METPEINPEEAEKAIINGDAQALVPFLINHQHSQKVSEWLEAVETATGGWLEKARAIIVQKQGFGSWSEFEAFKQQVNDESTETAQFEKAIDAIVSGDTAALKELLSHNPDLVHVRSLRRHKATLLIYTGANGIEGFRQKTPPNAVEIVSILLDAGAEIDAIGTMYRGTTTLGLVATSVHPVKTGVQEALIDLLLARGADFDKAVAPDYTEGNLINACLHNGRGEAAAYLAGKGAPVDMEGAAGTGMIDNVKAYYDKDGGLKEDINEVKRNNGFMWACEYGHRQVVEFMLAQGFDVSLLADGMTALHWASIGGHIDIMQLLMDKGAPLETKNSFGGTVLGQTLWSAYNDPKPVYPQIIDMLLAAGAHAEPELGKYIEEIRGWYS